MLKEDRDIPLSDNLVELLVQLDQQPAGSSASVPGTSQDVQDEAARAARGLEIIKRVRQHTPYCVIDLTSSGESDSPVHAGITPTRIGRFQIRRRLGTGGFGVVFLAFDPQLEREVALKVPRVETLINDQTRKRFLRESKAAARVNHPNVATIYEAGTIGPVFYIASEYCAGGSVAEFLDSLPQRRLPVRAAARLMMVMAEAVQSAHDRGVLHRDIKPTNILLDIGAEERGLLRGCADELADVARLVDFGLAKSLDASDERTRSGMLIGTPAYTAPEQVAEGAHRLGPAADVYSLGATLYHLLTGEPPLQKETDFATLVAGQSEEPVPPGRKNPAVPKDMDAICLMCLEKDPRRRYASTADLAADLRRFLSGVPVTARRPSRIERLSRWCRRNPSLVASTVVSLIVFLAAGSSVTLSFHMVQLEQRRTAELTRRIQDANRRRIAEEGHRVLGSRRPVERASGPSAADWRPTLDLALAGRVLAAGFADEIRLFDLFTWEKLDGFTSKERLLLCDARGRLILVGDRNRRLYCLPLATRDSQNATELRIGPLEELSSEDASAWAAEFAVWNGDSRLVGMAKENRWSVPNARMSITIPTGVTPGFRPQHLAIDPRGNWVIVATTEDDEVLVWDVGQQRFKIRLTSSPPRRVMFSPNGQWLAVIDAGRCRLWNTRTWAEQPRAPRAALEGDCAFSPDGRIVAVTPTVSAIELYRIPEMDRLARLAMRDDEAVATMCFTPDSAMLIACSPEGVVNTWDFRQIRGALRSIDLDWSLPECPPADRDQRPPALHIHRVNNPP